MKTIDINNKDNLQIEKNKNRSIISNSIINKNILVVGENISEIAIGKKILTPETISYFYEQLLEEEVFIGTNSTYSNTFKLIQNIFLSHLIDYSVPKPFNNCLNIISCLISGSHFGNINSKSDIEKNDYYNIHFSSIFRNIEQKYHLKDSKYYIDLKEIMNSQGGMYLDDKYFKGDYVPLKNLLPGLLLLSNSIKKEVEEKKKKPLENNRLNNLKGDFLDRLSRIVEGTLKSYSKYINNNFLLLLNINKEDENNDIFFNLNTLSKTRKSKDSHLDIYIDFLTNEILPISRNKDISLLKNSALNDFSINILNSNDSSVKKNIIDCLETNENIKSVVILDSNIDNYKDIINNVKYQNINFIFNGETINYTYLSPENVIFHSFNNKLEINEGKKISTFYTKEQQINNNDTMNIENLFLFNMVKNIFYTNEIKLLNENSTYGIEAVDLDRWLQIEFPGGEEKINKSIKFCKELDFLQKFSNKEYVESLNLFQIDYFNKLKINLNIIGLNVENKNDVLSLANVSDNYKYMQLMFKTIDGDFSRMNEYDVSWFLNESEEGIKKQFLDFVIKKYRSNFRFLTTEKGKEIRTANDYLKIESSYEESILKLKEYLIKEVTHFIGFLDNSDKLLNIDGYRDIYYEENLFAKESKEKISYIVDKMFKNIFEVLLTRFNIKNNDVLYFEDFTSDSFILEDIFSKELFKILKEEENNPEFKDIFNLFNNFNNIDDFFLNNKNNLYKVKIVIDRIYKNMDFNMDDFVYNFSKDKREKTVLLLPLKNYIEKLSKWFEINYHLDRHTPIKSIIMDFEKILNGDNIWKLKDRMFQHTQENIKLITDNNNFKKMKESYGFYLFDKKNEVFKLKDINSSKEDVINNPKELIETTNREEVFKEITGVENYYSDNLYLSEDKKKLLNAIEGEYLQSLKESLSTGIVKNFIEELKLQEDREDIEVKWNQKESHNLHYYYHHLYKDIKQKMEDEIFDINKSSVFLNKIPLIFLNKFNKNESMELTYYSLKGELSSKLNDKYLKFNKNDQKNIREFLIEVSKSPYVNEEFKVNFQNSCQYLLESLSYNIGDLVLKNIFNRYERNITDKNFHFYQIIKIYINNLKVVTNDNLINSIYNSSLIEEKMNNELFFRKSNNFLINMEYAIKELEDLKDSKKPEYFSTSNMNKINNLLSYIVSETELQFSDFGENNYTKIKKDLNKTLLDNGFNKQNTLLSAFNNVFTNQFLNEAQLDNRKDFHSFYISIPGFINPILENIIKEISEKYRVSILVFSPTGEEQTLKKIFNAFDDNITEDKKYCFNLVNIKQENLSYLDYDRDILEINLPEGVIPVTVREMCF